MSLLGTQVYANPDTSCWLSVNGGQVSGNVTIKGTLDVSGAVSAPTMEAGDFVSVDGSGTTILRLTNSFGAGYIQTPSNFLFSKVGQSTANTNLVLSAPGANLDVFTTNFLNAIGPIPANIITSPKTINPVPISPAAYDPFLVDVPFPTISNAVYDVQATGVITLASGVSDPDDSVRFEVDAGTGTSITTYTVYPEGPGQSGNWAIRQRIVANAVQASLLVAVQATRAGASTADYSATMNYFSATRVA